MLQYLIEYDRRHRGAYVPASSDASSVRMSLELMIGVSCKRAQTHLLAHLMELAKMSLRVSV